MDNIENNEEKKTEESTEDTQADNKNVKRRRRTGYERHLVPCPHCGKEILDHFTECPHCHGAVEPLGYRGDEKKIARIKRITTVIGIVLSIGLIVAFIAISNARKSDKTDATAHDGHGIQVCREIDFRS